MPFPWCLRSGLLKAAIFSLALAATVHMVAGRITATSLERFHNVEAPPSNGPNIVLLVVDTLRADHVGIYGYRRDTTPHIDAFFGRGHVYERAYAPVPSTGPSMVSMLSGLYPQHHGVRLLCQRLLPDVITFVDHLRRAGYQAAAVVSNAVLADSATGLAARFDYYDDFVDEQEPFRDDMFERTAARTTDAALYWLTAKRDTGKPFFLWVHYIDPHGPYRPPEDKPVDFSHSSPAPISPDRVPSYARESDVTDGNEYVDRYDEEIAYTDREVGRLLETLEHLGLADGAAMIFTSDHGESMMDHDQWFRHEVCVYEEMVRVPLAIRYGTGEAARSKVPVSTIDLMPTILELASLPLPEGLDAASLLPAPRPRNIFCEGAAEHGGLWRGVVSGQRKVMARHGMSNVVRESRGFDLSDDPDELRPLVVPPGDEHLQMLTRLIEADPDPGGRPRSYVTGALPGRRVAPGQDDKMLRHLRALGYVGG